jgi:ubiquinone/menaquinone biosynthesis C-methylase UbiE
MMSGGADQDRFNRWAGTYERHWMQRRIFVPVQRTVLERAAASMPQPRRVLDIGCGTGRLLRAAEARFPEAELFGVDAASEMVKQAVAGSPAGSSIRYQQAVAEHLPFANGQFDLVFSTMTFHHWHDQRAGAAEVARVLTPRGRWLIADFMPTGLVKYVRRLFRTDQFLERQELAATLSIAGLGMLSETKTPGLGGQVAVVIAGSTA